jgi:hypothetical protein
VRVGSHDGHELLDDVLDQVGPVVADVDVVLLPDVGERLQDLGPMLGSMLSPIFAQSWTIFSDFCRKNGVLLENQCYNRYFWPFSTIWHFLKKNEMLIFCHKK